MKIQTLWRVAAVKEALLSLPNTQLYNTIELWLDQVADKVWDVEVLDEMHFALGYSLESWETRQSYTNWEDLELVEPEYLDVDFISPSPLKLRRLIETMDLSDFYHQIIFIAGQVLGGPEMGWPPCSFSDGCHFMENLVDYLGATHLLAEESLQQDSERCEIIYI
ncbi:hypothetical protein [Lyngbya aestuarii]|uniref:hypothetical protein n=1 Tax=Lyngbya aestuarii TaxID=118322 RepID=UPI00403DA434